MAKVRRIIIACALYSLLFNLASTQDDPFPVSIIHLNDFHARFEEVNLQSSVCKQDEGDICVGGYARVVTKVRELLELKKDKNPIYLNAGDNFQGTLWYNIFRWEVTSHFLNLLPADAVTLGNHEFDHGLEGVVPFMQSLNSPILISNVDDSEEPTFQGLYQKSMIIDKYDRKIGIIGVMLNTTDKLSNTENLKFLPETEAVRTEAANLKSQGVDIIIVLSHSGVDVDGDIAKNCGPDVDVIVGAHTHTFLYTGDNPPGPDTPRGDYPTTVLQDDGHAVYVVQASAYTKYLGDITFYFDAEGNVVSFEGEPIFLDASVDQASDIMEEMAPWKEVVDAEANVNMGISRVKLDKDSCRNGECNLGSLITDSMVAAYVDQSEPGSWTYASIALINGGGIKTTLSSGSLTYGELFLTLPFQNTLDSMELKGNYLWDLMEFSLSDSYNMLQTSGLKLVGDMSEPIGKRVKSIDVLCNECLVPVYEPINLDKVYRLIVPNYIANGGDGFVILSDNKQNHRVGPIDLEAFSTYVVQMQPIIQSVTGRMKLYH